MTDTTIDWRAIVDDDGYFTVRVPAHALAEDLATVIDDATVEVTAAAGELDGVIVAFHLPDRYEDVWFVGGDTGRGGVVAARQYAAARRSTPQPTT